MATDLPSGARLLALSDLGRAYEVRGRLIVETATASMVMEPINLDALTEMDMLIQAAGDMIADMLEKGTRL